MNLVVDVGNTRVKVAVFEYDILKKSWIVKQNELLHLLKEIVLQFEIKQSILSTVTNFSSILLEKIKKVIPVILLNQKTKVPFENLYDTPKTLGVDRIALVAAASQKIKNKNVLIIDAGTCITYDFINSNNQYLGGAIAPGIQMRFKSLHKFTSKLPLVKEKSLKSFIGKNTAESINIGVVNGVLNEIELTINQYQSKFLDLTIVLTGGDAKFLSKQLKSSIFANQNFLLEGLNEILIFNSKE